MRRRLLLAVLSAGAALLSAGVSDRGSATEAVLPIKFGGPFALVDHNGDARTERDFHGRFMLISFGYTYCPDICPTGLNTMANALDLLGEKADRLRPVFVSIDPGRDTPAVLKEYLAQFHPRLIGLTGAETQVAAAARVYKVHRRKVVLAESEGPDDYFVDHSSITYLMGPDGDFVTLFPHGVDAETMAGTLAKYLS